jgi:hypothetical protein
MKNKIFLSLVWFLFLVSNIQAQSGYMIGTSHVSIEPDHSVFSVALAGYGAPREGRFSISWKYIGKASAIRLLTGSQGKLYAVNTDNELLEMHPKNQMVKWEKIGTTNHIRALTSLNKNLYAVDDNGQLIERKTKRHADWKVVGQAKGITALTGLAGVLYAANDKNDLLLGHPTLHHVSWEKIGQADSILSLAGHGERIYGVDKSDKLWYTRSYLKHKLWVEIGRYNGLTYNIHIKQIAIADNKLYALAGDGKLYQSEQESKGNLSARALAIKSGNKTAVIVSLDLTGFNYSFINAIKDIIYKRDNIPPSAILINAAHDHFAPVTQAWLTWEDFYHRPDSIYLNQVVKKNVVKAIELALDDLSPENLYFRRGTTGIGINRSNAQKPHDTTLDVLKVQNKEGETKCVLFSTPCHVVFSNAGREAFTLSANFPGVARNLITNKLHASNALFIQGCAGDINPKDPNYSNTGTELAEDVVNIVKGKMKQISGKISYKLDTIQIHIKPWDIPKIEQFKKDNSNKEGDVIAEKNVRWANLMLSYYKKGTMPHTMPIYVQTINIGDWKLVGLSREAVNEYAPAIRSIWPGKIVTVAAYSNDVSSYLPRDWHIESKTYEGYNSFFWYGQPAIFPTDILKIVTSKIKAFDR